MILSSRYLVAPYFDKVCAAELINFAQKLAVLDVVLAKMVDSNRLFAELCSLQPQVPLRKSFR
jgi:hypothetical protein